MESKEGLMKGTQRPENISTRLQRVAELARAAPNMAFTTLAHHIDVEFLKEAFRQTRKNGAVGVDGQDAAMYAANLEENLETLLNRFKSGSYKAPPVRRVHIPKGDGKKTRPIGIPSFEDKVLQRAVVIVLEAIYELELCI
jgi:RNA-directed DNA polymerase